MNKVWEVQQLINSCWENAWNTVQFETQQEAQDALDAHLKDLGANMPPEDIPEYMIAEVTRNAKFDIGYQFKLPGYKHMSSKDLNMMVTYRYHNGECWRYHCGLILCKEGEPIPAPYDKACQVRELSGFMYCDYCTADEQEIENESRK